MKRYLTLFFVLALVPILFGMSALDSTSSPDKIPVPEKKYRVTFVDQMDVTAECQNASIDGNTFLKGKIGSGVHAIGFDQIKVVLFHLKNDNLIAVLKLKDNSAVELSVDKKANAFGMTKFGSFHIKLIDLKKMVIEELGK